MSRPGFWEDLYQRHGDGWELGGPSPALVEFVESTPPPTGRVAVPGCGRGHDVRYLARRGYQATGFDFADDAIRAARALEARERSGAEFEQRDLFSLGATHAGAFDGLWEYTCYCAIDPARRAEYLQVIRRLLRPGGWFLACFYPVRPGKAGPPFPVSPAEVRRLLGASFRLERSFRPIRSVPRRSAQEWMVLARRIR